MRWKRWIVATLLLAVCGAAFVDAGPKRKKCGPQVGCIQAEVASPYVELRASGCYASGVVVRVGEETFILTAAHVAEHCAKWEARKSGVHRGAYWHCEVFRISKRHDLAILRVKDPGGLNPCRIAKDEPKQGAELHSIGTPHGIHGFLEKTHTAIVRHEEEGREYLVTSGLQWFGASGGPVFLRDANGYALCGIISRGAAQFVHGDTLNPRTPTLCVPLEEIKLFLEDCQCAGGCCCNPCKGGCK
jgi:hypothetical protein